MLDRKSSVQFTVVIASAAVTLFSAYFTTSSTFLAVALGVLALVAWLVARETAAASYAGLAGLQIGQSVIVLRVALSDCDRNGTAFSRESRLSFLDHRLVEFVFSLPSEHLVAGGITKVVLRDAMKGVIPSTILDRTDKVGFATPERDWMVGPLATWMTDRLGAAKRRGIVAPAVVDREWARLRAGGANSGNLWRIVNLESWFQSFIDVRP